MISLKKTPCAVYSMTSSNTETYIASVTMTIKWGIRGTSLRDYYYHFSSLIVSSLPCIPIDVCWSQHNHVINTFLEQTTINGIEKKDATKNPNQPFKLWKTFCKNCLIALLVISFYYIYSCQENNKKIWYNVWIETQFLTGW